MPTAFLVSAALGLLLIGSAGANGVAVNGDTRQVPKTASAGSAQLAIRTSAGTNVALAVTRDTTVASTAKPAAVEIVGELPGVAIVIIDSYPSIPGGMSYCQAGRERFLRVISIAKSRAVETYRTKLESCRDNIELASPGLEWLPDSATLRIRWLQGPGSKATPQESTIRIGPDGRPLH